MRTLFLVVATVILVSGCASSSNAGKRTDDNPRGDAAALSFVGKWRAENPNKKEGPVTMDIHADGTFSGVSEDNPPSHFSGTWTHDTANSAVFTEEGSEGTVKGHMINAKQMVVDATDDEGPLHFERQP